jgi:hypothetical protein
MLHTQLRPAVIPYIQRLDWPRPSWHKVGAVSLTAVFLSMSNWISGLNAMVQDPATKDLPSYLTGDRFIRLGLLHRTSILEKCKDGLEG